MSKRKPVKATKRAPKRAAQRAKQTVVRSPKPRSVAAERHDDVKPEAHIVADTAMALVAGPATALQSASSPKQEFASSSTTANVRTYQAKLLELTQANLHLAFEFVAKLAAVRSPVDLFNVMAETTNKRIVMLQNFSMRNG